MKQLLVAALLLAATAAGADERLMSVSEVLRVAPSLHERPITVTAMIRDGGVHHGLFLEDLVSRLSVSKIANPRWGRAEEQWECRIEAGPGAFQVTVVSGVTVTSHLNGTVLPLEGHWFEAEVPSLLIWRHPDGKPERAGIAQDGTIGVLGLEEGRYCLAASARGFNTVMGRLDIRYTSPERPVEIVMHLAN